MEKYLFVEKYCLSETDFRNIKELEKTCKDYDNAALKLELEYRKNANTGMSDDYNDFICYCDDDIVGYVGISKFGGRLAEVNGVVHPNHRKKGIFTYLFSMIRRELEKRQDSNFLALCDNLSPFKNVIETKYNGHLDHIEYEMFYSLNIKDKEKQKVQNIELVKANNQDAMEIRKQNSIFEGKAIVETDSIIPEEEEKKGMTVFLIKKKHLTVGKIHLTFEGKAGGIFGFFIYPEYRGQGLGKESLYLAKNYFLNLGADKIFLQVDSVNDVAHQLYKSFGFVTESAMAYYLVDTNPKTNI